MFSLSIFPGFFRVKISLSSCARGQAAGGGALVGLDVHSGGATDTAAIGVWDNYRVKKQYLHLSTVLATQLLLVDEVMKAGAKMGGGGGAAPGDEFEG